MDGRADDGAHDDGFQIEVVEIWPGIAVVDVAGDVDLHSAPEFREALSKLVDGDTTRQVTLDLSDVTFLDSMAIGVILGAKKRLVASGRDLELVVGNPDIRRIFEITMLDRIFALHATLAEAGIADYKAASTEG
jgi:anti-sigma B factor antagonist